MTQTAHKQDRYCIIVARVITGIPGDYACYRANMLLESSLHRLDYTGMCEIFSISSVSDWERGIKSKNFSGIEPQVEYMKSLIPPTEVLSEIIFVSIRPDRREVDFREWGKSGTIVQI